MLFAKSTWRLVMRDPLCKQWYLINPVVHLVAFHELNLDESKAVVIPQLFLNNYSEIENKKWVKKNAS